MVPVREFVGRFPSSATGGSSHSRSEGLRSPKHFHARLKSASDVDLNFENMDIPTARGLSQNEQDGRQCKTGKKPGVKKSGTTPGTDHENTDGPQKAMWHAKCKDYESYHRRHSYYLLCIDTAAKVDDKAHLRLAVTTPQRG